MELFVAGCLTAGHGIGGVEVLLNDTRWWPPRMEIATLFAIPALGFVAVCTSAFYIITTFSYFRYLTSRLAEEHFMQELRLVGQRVTLLRNTPCVLRHLVDKPRLNGERGKLVDAVPDAFGRYEVEMDEQCVRNGRAATERVHAEEFQLRECSGSAP